jgi:hypothetical protein
MQALIEDLKYPEYYLGPDEVTKELEDEAESLARALARINQ